MSGKKWLFVVALLVGCEGNPPYNPSPSRLLVFGSFYNTRVRPNGNILVIEDISLDLLEFDAAGERRTVHPFCRWFDIYGDVAWVLPMDGSVLLRLGLSPGAAADTFDIPGGFSLVAAMDSSRCILVTSADSFFIFDAGNPVPRFLFRHHWNDPLDYNSPKGLVCRGSEIFLDDGDVLDTSGKLLESWPGGHDFIPWGSDALLFLSEQGNLGKVNRSTGKTVYFPSRVSARSEARSPALSPDGGKAYFCATDETWDDEDYWWEWGYCLYEYRF